MTKKPELCSVCGHHERILYKSKYANKDWIYLCQQCFFDIKSQNQDTFEVDETWRSF
ncbi:MAG: hypothetical protein O3A03_04080 [Proteobacteria bacterium]|jgi:hypothetical protein|nr:hypothetical protein [Pseudomonadota bacterium]MDA0942478.1 hypothetical protein [Pseudomonadota bacterium]